MAPAAADLRTRLLEAWTTLRDAGLRTLMVKTLQELRLYRRLELVEVPLVPRPLRLEPAPGGIRARELVCSLVDLEAYVRLRPDVPASEARNRLQRGERCFVAEQDGQIISAVWTATGAVRIEYLQCDLELAPRDAYAYDAFTVASRRGEDLASVRSDLMRERMRVAGCRYLIAAQLPENTSQGRRAARFGYRPLGVIGCYGIGRWRRIFVRERRDLDEALGIRVLTPCLRSSRPHSGFRGRKHPV